MDKILLVDDEIELSNMIKNFLDNQGFTTVIKHTFQDGLLAYEDTTFDAVILDINLPDKSGLELCKYIRDKSELPIIMLSARSGDVDKIMGLGLGSDDYITKPFSASELSARIKAHISRHKRLSKNVSSSITKVFGDLSINEEAYEVTLQGKKILLPAKEFQLLNLLSSHPNKVFSKEQLLNQIWGYDGFGDINTVTVHVRKIREKIEKDSKNPTYIKTVWGVGYKFDGTQ